MESLSLLNSMRMACISDTYFLYSIWVLFSSSKIYLVKLEYLSCMPEIEFSMRASRFVYISWHLVFLLVWVIGEVPFGARTGSGR